MGDLSLYLYLSDKLHVGVAPRGRSIEGSQGFGGTRERDHHTRQSLFQGNNEINLKEQGMSLLLKGTLRKNY